MSITTEQYNRLCRFLDADMTLEEMEAFETELVNHPEMQQQLDFEQSIREGFAFMKMEGLSQSKKNNSVATGNLGTNNISINKKQNGQAEKKSRKIWLAIAVAATVLAAIISIVVFKTTKRSKLPEIVKQNSSPIQKKRDTAVLATTNPAITDTFKTTDLNRLFKHNFTQDKLPESYPMYLAEAFTDYENGKHITLQKIDLQNLPDTRGGEEDKEIRQLGHYYKGISFLKTDHSKFAILNLKWVVQNSSDTSLQVKAKWYLALAYIKSIEPKKAIEYLLSVAGSTNNYTAKAKEVLKEIQ